jgi:biopolymer transport protein ExbD
MAIGSFSSGSSFEGGASPMADINTTPLVDVMLVLLVIFIVTAPLMTQAIPVRVPQTAAVAAPPPAVPPVRLSLNERGEIFWNDAPIPAAVLQEKLGAAAALRPQPEIRVAADQETRYGRLADLLAEIKRAGIEKMGFVTQARGSK